jgi:dolichol-phosphate mannosyltransferase
MSPTVSAVMFAFNEAAHLEAVVRETLADLAAHTSDHQLVVVDDGSTDETPGILVRLAAEHQPLTVVTHPENRGIGEAVHSGYSVATMDYVCILPADGQIRMSQYIDLLEVAEAGADLILGRYRQRGEVDRFHRLVLSRGLRLMIWAVLGVRRQIDSAFLFRRSLLDEIPLTSRTFFVNLELPIRVIRGGYRVEEVPMEVFPRISGRSKVVQTGKIARVARDVFKLRLQLWREARRAARTE